MKFQVNPMEKKIFTMFLGVIKKKKAFYLKKKKNICHTTVCFGGLYGGKFFRIEKNRTILEKKCCCHKEGSSLQTSFDQ